MSSKSLQGGSIRILWDASDSVEVTITNTSGAPVAFTVNGAAASFPYTMSASTTFATDQSGRYEVSVKHHGVEVANTPDGTRLVSLKGGAQEAFAPTADGSSTPEFMADLHASLSGTYVRRGSVGDRMRKAAAGALNRSMEVHPTPPTITTGTTNLDATLTRSYRTQDVGTAPYRVTGGTATQGAGAYSPYLMAPVVTTPGGTGGNTPGSGATTSEWHWSVEFDTDAPKVLLRHLNSSKTYMIEVDGRPVSANGMAYPGASGTGYTMLNFGTSQVRRIRVWFMEATGFDGVYVGPTYSIWKPKSETDVRAVVIGDSIETGAATTIAGQTVNQIAGKYLGWTDVRQVAFGGTGYVAAGTWNTYGDALRVQDAVNAAPDVLLIATSQNDEGQSGLQAAALSTFQTYRAAFPEVPIVVLGAHAGSSGPSAARVALEDTALAAFNEWADDNSWFLPVTATLTDSWESGTGTASAPSGSGNRDRYGSDTAHPNAAGHVYLGQRLANAFRESVLPHIP